MSNTTNPTVLLVDDEPSSIRLFKRALDKEPYRILIAESGEQGLEILNENDVDIIVSDEKMPNMSGTEFLSKVREDYPKCVRIMITGHATLDLAMKAIQDGLVYQYLHKPVSATDFAAAIANGLALKMLGKVGFKQNGRANTDLPEYAAPTWGQTPNGQTGDVSQVLKEIRDVLDLLETSDSIETVVAKLRAVIDDIAAKHSS